MPQQRSPIQRKHLAANHRWRTALLLTGILLLGFVARCSFLENTGHSSDQNLNQTWGRSAVEIGLARSYVEQIDGATVPNYPPFGLMVFAGAAHLYKTLISPDFEVIQPLYRGFIKLPAILADLLICLFLFAFLTQWRSRKAGLLAALIYALHPVAIHNSAIWGQTDAIYTLFAMASVYALLHKDPLTGGGFAILGLLTKPQGVIFVPLLLFLIRLHWRDVGLFLLGSIVVLGVVITPFVVGDVLHRVLGVYTAAVGSFPTLTANAYNLWWALFADAANHKSDTDLFFGLMTYRHLGIFLFAAVYALVPLRFWGNFRGEKGNTNNAHTVVLCAGLVAFAFFVLNTQMHERYLFPFMVFGLPAVFLSRRGAVIYLLVSVAFLFNQLGVISFSDVDRALFREFPLFDAFIASAQVALLVLYICLIWPMGTPIPMRRWMMRWMPKR